MKLFQQLLFILLLGLIFTSCAQQKAVQYLQTPLDTTKLTQVRIPDPVVQKGDLLSITIYSKNPEASAIYNQQGGGVLPHAASGLEAPKTSTTSATGSQPGFLVSNEGNLYFVGVVPFMLKE